MRLKKSKIRHVKQQMLDKLKLSKPAVYDPEFKKTVVSFAEKKGNKEARRLYGVPEYNIRRWRGKTRLHTQKPETPEIVPKVEPKQEVDTLDSMPLQQRLKNPASSSPPPESPEQVLQSQPLSPTKLKVTRHVKPSAPSPSPVQLPPPPPTPPIEEVCLKWNSHHSNMQNTFPALLLREQYVDATLVAEGQTLKCHRVILSSCSPYFEEVLASISPYQHPVLFMKDVPFWTLKCICDFMYSGEIHILQTKLDELLAVAESLKVKGLAGQIHAQTIETKPDLTIPIKEEQNEEKEVKKKEEIKKKDEKEVKRKEEKEIKKKEEKEIKKKEEKEIKKKEEKEIKKKEEKEIKKKEEKEIKKKDEKEIKKKEEKEIKRKDEKELKKKEEKEIKKKDEKELKKKEEVKLPEIKQLKRKEEKEIKKKDEKEVKKKEEIKEVKEKKRALTTPPPEAPVVKSRKVPKLVLHGNMPVLKNFAVKARNKAGGIKTKIETKKAEKKLEKEKTPVSERPQKVPITKDSPSSSFSNPYDLLKPVYEVVAKNLQPKPPKVVPPKETVRRTLQKKLKKRKLSDSREESPPPPSSRKGRRRKIPKYSHPNPLAKVDESTIVREPHTDQAESFLQMQAIKAEPLYDDSIEIEDNLVGFSETSMSVEEQLIGSIDSGFGRRSTRRSKPKMQPIIMDVNKITNKKDEHTLKIVNVAELKAPVDPLEDPLGLNQSSSDSTAIVENADNDLGFRISQVITEKEDSRSSDVCREMGFQITSIVSQHDKENKIDEVTTKIEAPDEEEEVFNEFEDSTSQPEDQKPIIYPNMDEVDKNSMDTSQPDCSSIKSEMTTETFSENSTGIVINTNSLETNEELTQPTSTAQEYDLNSPDTVTFKIKTELLTEAENELDISQEEEDGLLNDYDEEIDEVDDNATNPIEISHESEHSIDHTNAIENTVHVKSEITIEDNLDQVVRSPECVESANVNEPINIDEPISQVSLEECSSSVLSKLDNSQVKPHISAETNVATNKESVIDDNIGASFLSIDTPSDNQFIPQDDLLSPKINPSLSDEVDPLNEDHPMDETTDQITEIDPFIKSSQAVAEELAEGTDVLEPKLDSSIDCCLSTQRSPGNLVEPSLDLEPAQIKQLPQTYDGHIQSKPIDENVQSLEVHNPIEPVVEANQCREDFLNENDEQITIQSQANETKSIEGCDLNQPMEDDFLNENDEDIMDTNKLVVEGCNEGSSFDPHQPMEEDLLDEHDEGNTNTNKTVEEISIEGTFNEANQPMEEDFLNENDEDNMQTNKDIEEPSRSTESTFIDVNQPMEDDFLKESCEDNLNTNKVVEEQSRSTEDNFIDANQPMEEDILNENIEDNMNTNKVIDERSRSSEATFIDANQPMEEDLLNENDDEDNANTNKTIEEGSFEGGFVDVTQEMGEDLPNENDEENTDEYKSVEERSVETSLTDTQKRIEDDFLSEKSSVKVTSSDSEEIVDGHKSDAEIPVEESCFDANLPIENDCVSDNGDENTPVNTECADMNSLEDNSIINTDLNKEVNIHHSPNDHSEISNNENYTVQEFNETANEEIEMNVPQTEPQIDIHFAVNETERSEEFQDNENTVADVKNTSPLNVSESQNKEDSQKDNQVLINEDCNEIQQADMQEEFLNLPKDESDQQSLHLSSNEQEKSLNLEQEQTSSTNETEEYEKEDYLQSPHSVSNEESLNLSQEDQILEEKDGQDISNIQGDPGIHTVCAETNLTGEGTSLDDNEEPMVHNDSTAVPFEGMDYEEDNSEVIHQDTSSNVPQDNIVNPVQDDPSDIAESFDNEDSLNPALNIPVLEKCDNSNMPEVLPHSYMEDQPMDENNAQAAPVMSPFSTDIADGGDTDASVTPFEATQPYSEFSESVTPISNMVESSEDNDSSNVLPQPNISSFEVNKSYDNSVNLDVSSVTPTDTFIKDTSNVLPVEESYLENQESFSQKQAESLQTEEASRSNEPDFDIAHVVDEQSSSNDPCFSSAQTSSEPGFHIAQVVNEQIAEIEGTRDKQQFVGDSSDTNEQCEMKVNTSSDLDSIVNDLSQIVGASCGVIDLPLADDTNSIADSLENLLQK